MIRKLLPYIFVALSTISAHAAVDYVEWNPFTNLPDATISSSTIRGIAESATSFLHLDGGNANQDIDVSPYRVSVGSINVGGIDLSSTTSGASGCSLVGIPAIGTPTNTTQCQFNNSFGGVGRATGGTISESGGTITISTGTGFIKENDIDGDEILSFDWAEETGFTVDTNTIKYFGIEYNVGSPQVKEATLESEFDLDTSFPLGQVINQAGEYYILQNPWWVTEGLTNVIERFGSLGHLQRDSEVGGLVPGYSGVRYLTMSGGRIWSRLTEHNISNFTTVGDVDDFDMYYRDSATTWAEVELYQWNNTQYNPITGVNAYTLQAIPNNQYSVIWIWVNASSQKPSLMFPQQYYPSAASAEAEIIPDFPAMWYKGGIIIGRFIVKEGINDPVEVQTAFDTQFSAALAADHGNLSGLSDDDHPQYWIAGTARSGDFTTTGDITAGSITAGGIPAEAYSIVIATYAGNGIDYVCDGTADNHQFQLAYNALPSGGSIFVKDGTYVFASSTTITADNTKMYTNAAIISMQNTIATWRGPFEYSTANDCLIDGFFIEGNSISEKKGIEIMSTSYNLSIRNCTFNRIPIPIFINSAERETKVTNCHFKNSGENTYGTIYVGGTYGAFENNTFDLCIKPFLISGNSNVIDNTVMNSMRSTAHGIVVSGFYNNLNNFTMSAGAGTTSNGLQVSGDYNNFSMFDIDTIPFYHGIEVTSTGDANKFSKIRISNAGASTSNTKDGLSCAGDRNSFEDITLVNTCDNYAINLAATADGNNFTLINASQISGNVGYLKDLGTNNQYINCSPTASISNKLINGTTIQGDLTASSITAGGIPAEKYNIVIGTYTANGIDIVCDGTADQTDFEAAIAALPAAGGSIFVLGGDYVFSAEMLCSKANVKFYSNSASITGTIAQSAHYFNINAANCLVEGFRFYAAGGKWDGVYAGANGDSLTIRNCVFDTIGYQSVGIPIYFYLGTVANTVDGCTFIDCRGYSTIVNRGNYSTFTRIKVRGQNFTPGVGFDEWGSNNRWLDVSIYLNDNYSFKFTGASNLLDGFSFRSTGGGGILVENSENTVANGQIIQTLDLDGIDVKAAAYGTVIANNVFWTIGSGGGSNDDSGIYIAGDATRVTDNIFYGSQDLNCIEIAATADGTVVKGNDWATATGYVVAFDNGGTNTQYIMNTDSTLGARLLGNTTIYNDLIVGGTIYGTSPIEIGDDVDFNGKDLQQVADIGAVGDADLVQLAANLATINGTAYVNGKVGIGAATPNTNLSVGGNSVTTILSASTNNEGVEVVPGVQRGRVLVEGSVQGELVLVDSGGSTNRRSSGLKSADNKTTLVSYNDAGGVVKDNIIVADHDTGNVSMANDLIVDGGDIGLTADADLIQIAANSVTVNGDMGVGRALVSGNSIATAKPISIPINSPLYWNGYYSGGFKYIANGYAGYINQRSDNGDLTVNLSASGAAGGAASMTERFRITNGGAVSAGGSISGGSLLTGGNIGIATDTDLLQLAVNQLTINGAAITNGAHTFTSTTLGTNLPTYAAGIKATIAHGYVDNFNTFDRTLDIVSPGGTQQSAIRFMTQKLGSGSGGTPTESMQITKDGTVQCDYDLIVDGGDIGLTADTDLIQIAANDVIINGGVTMTESTDQFTFAGDAAHPFTFYSTAGKAMKITGALDMYEAADVSFQVCSSSVVSTFPFQAKGAVTMWDKVTTYNKIATEGYGVPAIVDSVNLTGQSAAVGSTSLTNTAVNGSYRISYYLVAESIETGTETVTVTLVWNDGAGPRNVTSSSIIMAAGGYKQDTILTLVGNATAMTYFTTVVDALETATYGLYITVERLN